MDNRPAPGEQVRKLNRRSPDKRSKHATQSPQHPGRHDTQGTTATPLCSYLRTITHNERSEVVRVARELHVTENTVYRWLNGTSEPRAHHLRHLPDAFPDHRKELIALIQATFGEITESIQEPEEDIYQYILEIAAQSQDEETRFWDVSQALFAHVLQQMDPGQQGMAVTYAALMPPHADGIHSLREIAMRGYPPWPDSLASKAFLGSNTLVGITANTLYTHTWEKAEKTRNIVEIDIYELSTCTAPVMRGGLLAGVLIVSSIQPNYFKNSQAMQTVTEYSYMMSAALSDRDFQPVSLLSLRPMPALGWQRQRLAQDYLPRILDYARDHQVSYHEAECQIQHAVELEFEREARTI